MRVKSFLSIGAPAILFCGAQALSQTSAHAARLLVINKADHTLSIVDPESERQLSAVQVGGITGHEVAASPDGRTAWVPIYGNSGVGRPGTDGRTLTVVDLQSQKPIATVDFGQPARPHCAVFGPHNGKLYVTSELTRSIDVIDPATQKIVDSIPTGAAESHMLAISSDGKRGYTANVGPGTVSAIDLVNKKVVAVIPVSGTTQRIAISADDHWVFTADQTKPQLAVIDTATNRVARWIPLGDVAFGTAPTRDGRRLLITQPGAGKIAVLDLQSMKIERSIDVPAAPQEILMRPDGQVAYVSCDRSKQVAVVNLSSWKVDKLIDVGAGADGMAWAAGR
ncbi:MAG TPA: cytochrome D1 domain-containing protein [Candidatus Sulfotelmatobacter sp.]|nr:cytochrome D1 domain-containing protein [Candidatus Sulfotelmatobacter sp.]